MIFLSVQLEEAKHHLHACSFRSFRSRKERARGGDGAKVRGAGLWPRGIFEILTKYLRINGENFDCFCNKLGSDLRLCCFWPIKSQAESVYG